MDSSDALEERIRAEILKFVSEQGDDVVYV
jgi:hypothetical protein